MIFLCTHVKRHSKIGGAHQKNWEEKQCFVKQTKYCRVQICLGDGHYHKSEYTHTHTHTLHILKSKSKKSGIFSQNFCLIKL